MSLPSMIRHVLCVCGQLHAQKSHDLSRPVVFLRHGLQGGGEGEAGQQSRGPHSSCGPPLFLLWRHCLYWSWSSLNCIPFGVPGSTNLWQYGYLHQYQSTQKQSLLPSDFIMCSSSFWICMLCLSVWFQQTDNNKQSRMKPGQTKKKERKKSEISIFDVVLLWLLSLLSIHLFLNG